MLGEGVVGIGMGLNLTHRDTWPCRMACPQRLSFQIYRTSLLAWLTLMACSEASGENL